MPLSQARPATPNRAWSNPCALHLEACVGANSNPIRHHAPRLVGDATKRLTTIATTTTNSYDDDYCDYHYHCYYHCYCYQPACLPTCPPARLPTYLPTYLPTVTY